LPNLFVDQGRYPSAFMVHPITTDSSMILQTRQFLVHPTDQDRS
jgi:hypothetical protein